MSHRVRHWWRECLWILPKIKNVSPGETLVKGCLNLYESYLNTRMSHPVRHWGRSVWIYINCTQRWECLTRWDIGKGVFEFIEIIPKIENVSPGETWGGGGFVYYRNQTQKWKCLTRWDIGEGDVYESYLKLNMSHRVRHWGRSVYKSHPETRMSHLVRHRRRAVFIM